MIRMQNWFSRILSALGALVFFVVVGGFLVSPVQTVKRIGAPFMVLPAAIGLVPRITSSDVYAISLVNKSPEIVITQPGQYALYTDEQSVLMRANMLEAVNASWASLRAQSTGQETAGVNIVRGVLPFDPITVPGRPIVTFAVANPGAYTLVYPIQSGTVYFAPDSTTGREGVILLAGLAQIVFVVILGVGIFWSRIRRYRLQQQQLAAKLVQKRAHAEAFWQRHERGQEDANNHDENRKLE